MAKLLYPEMRKIMRSLSGITAAKDIAIRGLMGLRNFASVFKIKISDYELSVDGDSSLRLGVADSGNIEFDLPDLFESIGRAAQKIGKGWAILIDEVQYLTSQDLSALIVSVHRMAQENLPVIMVGAGLPQVAELAGDAKTYSERLFYFPKIDALSPEAARRAIDIPIKNENAMIEPEALEKIVSQTKGYPFFLQEWASFAWKCAEGPSINNDDVDRSYIDTINSLDNGFFRVRLDRLTQSEELFVRSMASLGNGP